MSAIIHRPSAFPPLVTRPTLSSGSVGAHPVAVAVNAVQSTEASNPFSASYSYATRSPLSMLAKDSGHMPRPEYAVEGVFTAAPREHVEAIRDLYQEGLRTTLSRPPQGLAIERVTADHLTIDLNQVTTEKLGQLVDVGIERAKKFYYFTSGAGLWSRGGGQVKATVPLNLAELLPAEKIARLSLLSDVVNAKTPADVLLMLKIDVPPGETVESVSARVVAESRNEIGEILDVARKDLRAMTPLAMKLAQAAVMSELTETHVPFDVWTSEQTHTAIAEYLEHFKANYAQMQFHDEPETQARVVAALSKYLAAGDSHLFGYQEGLPALRVSDGEPIEGSALIGEGAGRAKAYLDKSGRTDALMAAGKDIFSFENIEVMTDWMAVLGAHVEGGKPVSVVVVPQRKGYAGGNPFMVQKNDGTWSLELHEQSALPKELAVDNLYFNSNTIIQPLTAKASSNFGFEIKNNNTQARAKNNAGDVTQDLPTAGIGGRIGVEYENLKNYNEYVANGSSMIATFRGLLKRDLDLAAQRRAAPATVNWNQLHSYYQVDSVTFGRQSGG